MGGGVSSSPTRPVVVDDNSTSISVRSQRPPVAFISPREAKVRFIQDGSLPTECTDDELKFRMLLDDPVSLHTLEGFASLEMLQMLDRFKILMMKSRFMNRKFVSLYMSIISAVSVTASSRKQSSIVAMIQGNKDEIASCFSTLYVDLYLPFKEASACTKMLSQMKTVYDIGPNDFEYFTRVGSGAFGVVFSCRKVSSGQIYAMKVQPKAMMLRNNRKNPDQIMVEMLSGTFIKHPFICETKIAFQTPTMVFLAMPLCPCGSLHRALIMQPTRTFPFKRAQFYAAALASVLMFLHRQGLVYRDLKAENVLLRADGNILLCDLGSISDDCNPLSFPLQEPAGCQGSAMISNTNPGGSSANPSFGSANSLPNNGGGTASNRSSFTSAIAATASSLPNNGGGTASTTFRSELHRVNSILRTVGVEPNSSRYVSARSYSDDRSISAMSSYAYEMRATGVVGTLKYMSPEVLALFADEHGLSRVPGRTASVDWFSFGVLVHEMLTGRGPFQPPSGMTYQKLHKVYPDMLRMVGYDVMRLHTVLMGKFEPSEEVSALLGENGLRLVSGLVQLDPAARLGVDKVAPGLGTMRTLTYRCLRDDAFFEGIDWDMLEREELAPPHVPSADEHVLFGMNSPFTFEDILKQVKRTQWHELVPDDKDQEHFRDWFFMDPEVLVMTAGGEAVSIT